jgi:DNA-binding response OmpR family regulator
VKILLVEDDPELNELLVRSLSTRGFIVDAVRSAEDADLALSTHHYRAAIFDRNLPDGNGLDLLRQIRRAKQPIPVLMLTAVSGAVSRIEGLEAGADDYLEKPFDMNELGARLRALGRRSNALEQEILSAGKISFNVTTRMASTTDGPIKLSRREAALLEQFLRRISVTVLRGQLEQAIYGFDEAVTPNALEAHISRLRAKLNVAKSGLELHAMPGIGYLMSETMP